MTLPADPFSLLTAPGGRGPLRGDGDALVTDDGTRYAVRDGIVRMLGDPEPGLVTELEAQDLALPSYLDERLFITRYENSVARLVVEDLLGGAGGDILDAGCGVGLFGRLWPRLDLVGVDASVTLLAQARVGYRLRVECSVAALPFADGTFDAVMAVNMLHHVTAPERAVAEFARVLRPGGVLVSVDPREVAPIELAKRLLRRNNKAYAPTHRAFGVDEYRTLLGGGGAMEVEELRRVGFFPLLVGGGLDALGVSRFVPGTDRVVGALRRADDLLLRAPGLAGTGLNLAARARRR